MTNPFIPGARVAVRNRYGNGYTEGFVDKVHKPRGKYAKFGNITLRGSTQQYSVSSYRSNDDAVTWHATETGNGFSRMHVYPWTDAIDQEIVGQKAMAHRQRRIDRLACAVKAMNPNYAKLDGLLDAIEEFELFNELAPKGETR